MNDQQEDDEDMAWMKVPGLAGKVFVPGPDRCSHGKHPCPDCFACQGCGPERCRVCRGSDDRSERWRLSGRCRQRGRQGGTREKQTR